MIKKIKKFANTVMEYVAVISASIGIGCIICKIMGTDPWSWNGWTTKQKVIYEIVSTVIVFPVAIWCAMAHYACETMIEDDEI